MNSRRKLAGKPRHWSGRFAVVAAIATTLACARGGDPRPIGTLEDVLSLRERTDLNILFILVDTLRADRLSAYGYERKTSPTIDALAEAGIRFRHHVAQSSWTKCSMASLWTGLYPNRTGVLRARHALPEAASLPAEIFREADFRTAGLFRNGWVARNFGFAQGFEIYMSPRPPRFLVGHEPVDPAYVASSDDDVIRTASGFLRTHAGDRWFLYLHLLDVHQYTSDNASSIFGSSYSDVYDNAILWTDTLIGHLLAELDDHGLRDRTLVVLASDHGEAFREHGKDGHAFDVYGEVTEVPFILAFPFRLEPGVVVESRSENVDIWPTVLQLVGLPPLPDPDGVSLLPAIEAAARAERSLEDDEIAFAHLDRTWARIEAEAQPMVSVTDDRWRLLYRGADERLELFDKQEDPRERRNVASDHRDITLDLRETAEAYLRRSEAPWREAAPLVEIDEMELNQLRALGYGVQ